MNNAIDPLIAYVADYGIADYESRGFLQAFTAYVNAVDCDDMTHREACDRLRIGGRRWEDACAELYRLILDCPELYL